MKERLDAVVQQNNCILCGLKIGIRNFGAIEELLLIALRLAKALASLAVTLSRSVEKKIWIYKSLFIW